MLAGLTQERLAERSGISATGIAALEAGRRTTPRLTTVGLLCDALSFDPGQRAALIAAASAPVFAAASPSVSAVVSAAQSNANPPISTDAQAGEPNGSATPRAPFVSHSLVNHSFVGRSFVGRIDEQQLLRNSWARKVRVSLIFGEAGVGKTTLAEEFAMELGAQGVAVLQGRSTAQQLGAYEAFVAPVRTALHRFDGDLPIHLQELGRLVPGLFGPSNSVMVPSRSDPSIERRLLFETVARLLGTVGPSLLLLDDLQWADPATLALLAFLAAHQELADLMIVGTIRSTDVTPATNAALAELRRHCEVARIHVSGLNRVDLTKLVSDIAGAAASPALIEAVVKETNGNPLYIKELTEHLLQRGFDGTSGGPAIPEGIRQTIELRAAGLTREGQALLRSGAVLGQAFDMTLAGQLAGLAGEELLGAVEDALLSGLVLEHTARVAMFSHGLVATTMYEAMSQSRRLALHRSAAAALTAAAASTSAEIVNVARHWAYVAEADPLARATAAQWSVKAGDAAASSAAVDEAIACYERAVALWDAPTTERADALVRLGSAMMAAGTTVEGVARLEQGLEIADLTGESEVFARAALGLSASVRYAASDPQRIEQLEQAIAKLDPTEMVLRPALLATLRRQLGFVQTPEADARRNAAAALVAAAVLVPEVSDDLLISLGSLRDSLVLDDPVPLGELARKIITVASARQDLPVLSTGWYRQAWSALELGESVRFRHAVGEYRRIAEQLRRPYELALSANMIAAIAQIEGRYDDAEASGQEALAHAAMIDDGNFSWVYFSNSGLRAVDCGDAAATLGLMRSVRSDFAGLLTFEAALIAVTAAAGEFTVANALLDEQVGVDGEIIDRDWVYLSAERLPVVGMWAWGCGLTGNVRQATLLRERLLRIASVGVRVVRVAPVGAWIGPVDHHLGTLSRVMGDLDQAQWHLEQALLVEEEMNGHSFRPRTMAELAFVAAARGTSRGRSDAVEWMAKAQDHASRLGLDSMLSIQRPERFV